MRAPRRDSHAEFRNAKDGNRMKYVVEPVQDARIHIEKINYPFLFQDKAKPAEYGAGLKLVIERGWLWMHESGTYVKITPDDAALFA
jgi:hypothetical protein